MKRPSVEDMAMEIAFVVAKRSTCARALVGVRGRGAVALDHYSRIIGVGYNGVPSGFPHCTEVPCPGACQPTGGSAHDDCEAVHAEINCIINSHGPRYIWKMFLTHSPCFKCALALANLPSIEEVRYTHEYGDTRGLDILERAHIRIVKHD